MPRTFLLISSPREHHIHVSNGRPVLLHQWTRTPCGQLRNMVRFASAHMHTLSYPRIHSCRMSPVHFSFSNDLFPSHKSFHHISPALRISPIRDCAVFSLSCTTCHPAIHMQITPPPLSLIFYYICTQLQNVFHKNALIKYIPILRNIFMKSTRLHVDMLIHKFTLITSRILYNYM